MVATKSKLRRKADRLCREYSKTIPDCEARGDGISCAGRLEWAHCISRSAIRLRYDRRNWVRLCSAHHWFFGKNPFAFSEFIKKLKGEATFNVLRNNRPSKEPITETWYQEQIVVLQKLLTKAKSVVK